MRGGARGRQATAGQESALAGGATRSGYPTGARRSDQPNRPRRPGRTVARQRAGEHVYNRRRRGRPHATGTRPHLRDRRSRACGRSPAATPRASHEDVMRRAHASARCDDQSCAREQESSVRRRGPGAHVRRSRMPIACALPCSRCSTTVGRPAGVRLTAATPPAPERARSPLRRRRRDELPSEEGRRRALEASRADVEAAKRAAARSSWPATCRTATARRARVRSTRRATSCGAGSRATRRVPSREARRRPDGCCSCTPTARPGARRRSSRWCPTGRDATPSGVELERRRYGLDASSTSGADRWPRRSRPRLRAFAARRVACAADSAPVAAHAARGL